VTGVRGHRLHLVRVIEVDGGDLAMTIDDLPDGGLAGGAKGHRLADQPAADEVAAGAPTDGAVDRDDAHDLVRTVGDGWNGFWEGPRAGLIATGGHRVGERLVRALQVVAAAEGIELRLGRAQGGQVAVGENLGGDGAVEAFDLALRLGMADLAMPRFHPEAQQPGFQRREPPIPAVAQGEPLSVRMARGSP
jgi:hypothetical protein